MNKLVFVLLFVCGLAVSGFAQSSGSDRKKSGLPPFLGGDVSSRSRTVPSPSPSPVPTPSPEEDSASEPSQTSPPREKPVLQKRGTSGATPTPSPQASPTTPNTSGEVVEDDDEVLRVETALVTIPVTVLDRQGRFVPGLQQTDFEIYEDGKKQEIAYFAKTEQPFTVVLLLDVSNSTKFQIDEIQNAAITFTRQLKQSDRVMVIAFDERVHILTEPTSDRNRLYNAIRQAEFGGGTSLYDAVDYTLNRRLSQIQGRKAVVLFTDGVDTTSQRSNYQATLRDSEEQEATIYTIHYNTYQEMQGSGGGSSYPFPQRRRRSGGIGGILGDILGGGGGGIVIGGGGGNSRGSSRAEYEEGERYVGDLAKSTGGRMYRADSSQNLESAFYNIAEELRRQYAIGYSPNETGQNGQRKQIRVRVSQQGLIVRARDSYIVGEQAPTAQSNQ